MLSFDGCGRFSRGLAFLDHVTPVGRFSKGILTIGLSPHNMIQVDQIMKIAKTFKKVTVAMALIGLLAGQSLAAQPAKLWQSANAIRSMDVKF